MFVSKFQGFLSKGFRRLQWKNEEEKILNNEKALNNVFNNLFEKEDDMDMLSWFTYYKVSPCSHSPLKEGKDEPGLLLPGTQNLKIFTCFFI